MRKRRCSGHPQRRRSRCGDASPPQSWVRNLILAIIATIEGDELPRVEPGTPALRPKNIVMGDRGALAARYRRENGQQPSRASWGRTRRGNHAGRRRASAVALRRRLTTSRQELRGQQKGHQRHEYNDPGLSRRAAGEQGFPLRGARSGRPRQERDQACGDRLGIPVRRCPVR
jgi:hypothetical protein